MVSLTADFGFYPMEISIKSGDVSIGTLPDLDKVVAALEKSEGIERDWIYAPPQQEVNFGGIVRELPYASRVFGLPKTHTITHGSADGPEHLQFHVWALSFFLGMRLTTTEAGFVDATPVKPRKLVDFHLSHAALPKAIILAEQFWFTHRHDPVRAKRLVAAIHALFIAHRPQNLQYEQFLYLYTALDACYALAASLQPPKKSPSHSDRIDWMCNLFGIVTPAWASRPPGAAAEVAVLRNATLHEALFMNEPLGFAIHGAGSNQNLTLEMEALLCRLIVALIGGAAAAYVRSPVNTRMIHSFELP